MPHKRKGRIRVFPPDPDNAAGQRLITEFSLQMLQSRAAIPVGEQAGGEPYSPGELSLSPPDLRTPVRALPPPVGRGAESQADEVIGHAQLGGSDADRTAGEAGETLEPRRTEELNRGVEEAAEGPRTTGEASGPDRTGVRTLSQQLNKPAVITLDNIWELMVKMSTKLDNQALKLDEIAAKISYGSTVTTLSDKRQFPSFLRTVPSDDLQSLVIARLINFFGWTWVGILAENNDYGLIGSQMLKEELVKAGVCVAFYEIIPLFYSQEKIQRIVEVVKKMTAKVIVVFSSAVNLYPVMLAIAKSDISGKVWIASDGWSPLPLFKEKVFFKVLKATIGMTVPRSPIPMFKEYIYSLHPLRATEDIFVGQFWEKAFHCRWADPNMDQATLQDLSRERKLCTGKEDLTTIDDDLFDKTIGGSSFNSYNAVYIVARALHAMYTCEPGKGPFFNGTCGDIKHFEPWQLLHYVWKVRFKNTMGLEIFFDKNGNPPTAYYIHNCYLNSRGSFDSVKIGQYDSGAASGWDIKINTSAITWSEDYAQVPVSVCSESCGPGFRKAIVEGQPGCCFDCIPCSKDEFSNQTDATECMKCPDDQWPTKRQDGCQKKSIEFLSYQEPLGMVLAVISVLGTLLPSAILVVFIQNRHTPVVKANNRELSYLLLLALILSFGCSLVFIGHPTTLTCMVRHMTFGIVFAICISCLLAKTIMVVIAFKATKPTSNLKLLVGPRLPNVLVLACSLVQVLICVSWQVVAPPFYHMSMKSQMGKIVLECNEGSLVAFCLMMGYMGLLSTISFIVAFLARKLPDSFNEAKFITFSMLIFIAVWISFIPAYLSTTGKYTVAVEIFAILSSSAGLLVCIFFPKCYIILIRPDMNTKEFLMGKATGSLKKIK
ncbi:extracellular calcium-sensing receptor-like [Rhinatrema bivittatum]|uniref:extracellular calcium-sensing receptor-like n=1 Tax=Rhinatrema bivittatum TaxID=194408 RepID=UPI001127D897|nr:extracellular calcium-sensing receptor-like [Rhinatrema bivittatum]